MSKYEKGKIVLGNVTGIESYGVFVGLDEYYSGLIHISEISNGFVKDINDFVKLGETIRVKVLETNDELFQVKLSIKDINYRINKKKDNKIEEAGSGFNILKEKLPFWILSKKNEYNDKKN